LGKRTGIEWTDHTFNPWWGCTKVSPACTNCYAEAFSHRVGYDVWGDAAPRRTFAAAHWFGPVKWDDEARSAGVRRRVFCASMADVFEDREELVAWRDRLWDLIDATPHLDWLLLTKRPELVMLMVPQPWLESPPANVWYGTTVENQEWADRRVPLLLEVPARGRFLSVEPLLGPTSLERWLPIAARGEGWEGVKAEAAYGEARPRVDWVIAGGESGAGARPTHPAWLRTLRDQCQAAAVPFFFKQWGVWAPMAGPAPGLRVEVVEVSEDHYSFLWPDGTSGPGEAGDHGGPGMGFARVGKKEAGRALDGREWSEFPRRAEA